MGTTAGRQIRSACYRFFCFVFVTAPYHVPIARLDVAGNLVHTMKHLGRKTPLKSKDRFYTPWSALRGSKRITELVERVSRLRRAFDGDILQS